MRVPRSWALPSVAALAILVTGVVTSGLLAVTHQNVLSVYETLVMGSIGSEAGLVGTLTYATPLMFTGLAAAVAFRARVWNIGGDGQLFMGAFGTAWVALSFPHSAPVVLLPAVVLAGFVAGSLWALVPAMLRIALGVNEIMTSLMLNYVASLWVAYLVFGPWKDPTMGGWPYSPQFSPGAWLPSWENTGVNIMLLVAVTAAPLLAWALTHTRWGYEISIIGAGQPIARYAGMTLARNVVSVMLISGGLAGFAGVGEVAGVAHRLYELDTQGYGYTGIMVAWLGALRPASVVAMGLLFGALLQGGVALQMAGLSPSIVQMFQGTVVLVTLGCLTVARQRAGKPRLRPVDVLAQESPPAEQPVQ
jgi:simple sugar transport system permease protein